MANKWAADTHEKLHAAGYRLDTGPTGEGNGIKKCKYPPCEDEVIFYITPKGKDMPFEAVERESPLPGESDLFLQPHAATCVGYAKREADRKAGKAAAKK